MQCSRPTFVRARQRLNDLGVIRYEKGTTHKAGKYFYSAGDWLTISKGLGKDWENNLPKRLHIYKSKTKTRQDKKKIKEEEKTVGANAPQSAPLVELFNKICKSYPSIEQIDKKREDHIKARLKKHQLEEFKTVFELMESSKFLKGDNSRGWQASFDWVIKNEDNFVKVLEGRYDNGRKGQQNLKELVLKGPKFADGPDLSSLEHK